MSFNLEMIIQQSLHLFNVAAFSLNHRLDTDPELGAFLFHKRRRELGEYSVVGGDQAGFGCGQVFHFEIYTKSYRVQSYFPFLFLYPIPLWLKEQPFYLEYLNLDGQRSRWITTFGDREGASGGIMVSKLDLSIKVPVYPCEAGHPIVIDVVFLLQLRRN